YSDDVCASTAAAQSAAPPPKLTAEIENWLTHLGAERRYSPKTLEAYRREVEQFLDFLTEHLGGRPSLKELSALTPADVRPFPAPRRPRRHCRAPPQRTRAA